MKSCKLKPSYVLSSSKEQPTEELVNISFQR